MESAALSILPVFWLQADGTFARPATVNTQPAGHTSLWISCLSAELP